MLQTVLHRESAWTQWKDVGFDRLRWLGLVCLEVELAWAGLALHRESAQTQWVGLGWSCTGRAPGRSGNMRVLILALAWPDLARPDPAWPGLAWLGLACLGVTLLGWAWFGLAWVGLGWLGLALLALPGIALSRLALPCPVSSGGLVLPCLASHCLALSHPAAALWCIIHPNQTRKVSVALVALSLALSVLPCTALRRDDSDSMPCCGLIGVSS